ncbi:DUF1722 domain-containing protein [Anaerobacillus alkaliphilus]|uniref:DUF1722 domain-containing protein n=1 Tax=Anaerobacillus alkaliphilus TaxID=1548597 RepID=A0A4Q0VWP5_9BACI|nr:DUF1722 domain-containing protein [Anaerobacillus alkaliphilus]RXJ04064.1 DUF1722 domain-containing protein [Anaerobacillus alkaliphilus]
MKKIKITTEKLWAKNKYDVMAKGYQHYSHVKTLFKQTTSTEDYLKIYLYIKATRENPYTTKGMINTLEHLWGYFKKTASTDEKQLFFTLLAKVKDITQTEFDEPPLEINETLSYLIQLLERYDQPYLKNSTILYSELLWNEVTLKKETYHLTENHYVEE